MTEKLLTTCLNIHDPRIGERAFRRCELPGHVRDERLPAIELRELCPFCCERRKGPLVFVHGIAELLGLPKGAGDGDQRRRQAGLQHRDLGIDCREHVNPLRFERAKRIFCAFQVRRGNRRLMRCHHQDGRDAISVRNAKTRQLFELPELADSSRAPHLPFQLSVELVGLVVERDLRF